MKPPLSREELKARQDRFYAERRMRIEREPPRPRPQAPRLRSVRQGFDASYLARAARLRRPAQLFYERRDANPLARHGRLQAGTKTTAIRRLLEQRPDLLLRYEAALFLDDDVEIGDGDIDALFAAMARERLDLAQPALTADSDSAWPFLKRPSAEHAIIRVSTVEIMAPLLHAAALRTRRLGLFGNRQRLGNRPSARPRRARGFWAGRASASSARSPSGTHGRSTPRAAPSTPTCAATASTRPTRPTAIVADFGVERYLRPLAPGEFGVRLPNVAAGRRRPAIRLTEPARLVFLDRREPEFGSTPGRRVACTGCRARDRACDRHGSAPCSWRRISSTGRSRRRSRRARETRADAA